MFVTFEKKHKDVLNKIIPMLLERVFDNWHVMPQFSVGDFDDEYVSFALVYQDPTPNETQHRHEAMNLAMAFIAGYFSEANIPMD